PAGIPVLAALAFQLRYDARVTGDPWTLPYVQYERTYSRVPLFLFQEERAAPSAALAEPMAEFNRYLENDFAVQHTLRGYLGMQRVKLAQYGKLLWGWLFVPVVLVALRGLRRARAGRTALGLLAVFAPLVLLPTTYSIPHYVAPALPLVALLLVLALRWLAAGPRARAARRVVRGALGLACAGALLAFALPRLCTQPRVGWEHERAAYAEELLARPGRHLVLVRYAPGHAPHEEWVFNAADLDSARIVWARDLGAAANRALLAHHPDREVHTLTVQDGGAPRR